LRDGLVAKYQAEWESAIRVDRSSVAREYAPRGAVRPEVKLLKPVAYEVEFSKACEPVSVRATYRWRISWEAGGSPFDWCRKKVGASKTFECRKDEADWRCG
jgi:hypothetical protein